MGRVVLASSTFTGADELPLSEGGVWTSGLSSFDRMQRKSNTAQPQGYGGGFDAYMAYTGVVWPNDHASKGVVTMAGTTGSGSGMGLLVRYTHNGTINCYRLAVDHAATNNVDIARVLANVYTSVKLVTQAWSDGDTWEITVEGPANAAVLKAYLNGVLITQGTDNSTIPRPGAPGVGFSSSETSGNIDNWEGASITTDIVSAPQKPYLLHPKHVLVGRP